MLFYMCEMPNTCVFDIDVMQDIVMERYYQYLNDDLEYDTSNEYDILSHFIMCLISSKLSLMHDVIVKGETRLFSKKLMKMKVGVIKGNIAHSLNFLNVIGQTEEHSSAIDILRKNIDIITKILMVILHKGSHAFHEKHKNECQKYEMHIPFTFVSNLISKRKVEICQGKAKIPCGQWKIVMEEIFICFLKFELKFFDEFHMLQHVIYESEDDRLSNVIEYCIRKIYGKMLLANDLMRASDLDELCQYFPPCIANLHQILRQTHRLSYDSRYQYTLFLRDIGLPVEENVLFWKNEYTKPHIGSSCTHFWENKKSRYEYQIYHLYGFLGSKTQKKSHCCKKFIDQLTLRMNGGCPFAHLNQNALLNSLPRALPEIDIEDILNYKSKNQFQRACAAYLTSLKNYLQNRRLDSETQNEVLHKKSTVSEILSPFHYYYLARGVRKT